MKKKTQATLERERIIRLIRREADATIGKTWYHPAHNLGDLIRRIGRLRDLKTTEKRRGTDKT